MHSFTSTFVSKKPRRWLVFLMTLVVWAAIGAASAYASHFRYGHYSWQSAAAPNTINFTIQTAFRRDGYACYSTTTLSTVPCSAPDGHPGVGDVFAEFIGGTVFNPGDGSPSIGSPLGPLMYVVTSIDPAKNWLFALALDANSLPAIDTLVTHTYPAIGDYLAFTDSCCRISAIVPPDYHLNNPDGGYRVETRVNVGTQGANSSPVSALPPIVFCPINALCSFQVPGVDPDGDPLTYRPSTAPEANSTFPPGSNWSGTSCPDIFCQPGPPFAPNSATISSTGLYTWDTTGAQLAPAGGNNTLYSTQVTIEDRDSSSNVKGKAALDFLIQLVPSVGNPPQFDHPPTPTCGSTQTVNVGGTLTFGVQAADPDSNDVVTLNAAGLPPGATMTPPLPASGNPVSSTFTWTPGAPGTFVVTFTAIDQTLQQALCSIAVEAQQPPQTADLSIEKSGPPFARSGGMIIYNMAVHNGGPADATGVTVDDSLPASETLVSATPSQGTCSGNVTCSLGNIPNGGSATITIVAKVSAACGSTLTNTATVKGDQPDPDPSNNSSSTSAFVFCVVADGNFVIGDKNAAVGTAVTFWGAQWWKLNTLSGGPAPAAFKGFENEPAAATCGTYWSTDPGNSPPPPPGPLPAYMAVLVASSISKSGPTISGNTPHVVVVKTNPGFAPDPGHSGTGTVVGQIC